MQSLCDGDIVRAWRRRFARLAATRFRGSGPVADGSPSRIGKPKGSARSLVAARQVPGGLATRQTCPTRRSARFATGSSSDRTGVARAALSLTGRGGSVRRVLLRAGASLSVLEHVVSLRRVAILRSRETALSRTLAAAGRASFSRLRGSSARSAEAQRRTITTATRIRSTTWPRTSAISVGRATRSFTGTSSTGGLRLSRAA
jgi:hypothetical protein